MYKFWQVGAALGGQFTILTVLYFLEFLKFPLLNEVRRLKMSNDLSNQCKLSKICVSSLTRHPEIEFRQPRKFQLSVLSKYSSEAEKICSLSFLQKFKNSSFLIGNFKFWRNSIFSTKILTLVKKYTSPLRTAMTGEVRFHQISTPMTQKLRKEDRKFVPINAITEDNSRKKERRH